MPGQWDRQAPWSPLGFTDLINKRQALGAPQDLNALHAGLEPVGPIPYRSKLNPSQQAAWEALDTLRLRPGVLPIRPEELRQYTPEQIEWANTQIEDLINAQRGLNYQR